MKGVINTDQFDLIKQSLEILGYEPANDFLIAYDNLKEEKYQHLLPVYIKFLLSHKGFLDEMGLNKQGIEKQEQKNSASPVVRGLYNRMITDLIPIMSKTIKENPNNYALGQKEFALFIDFLERASPATCFKILSVVPIHERPEDRKLAMTKLLFNKLMWSKQQDTDEYKELLRVKFGGKYDLYDLLNLGKLKKEAESIAKYDNEEKIQQVDVKDTIKQFRAALNDIDLQQAEKLIKESKIDASTAQAILSDVMSKVENPDIFFEIYALTTASYSTSNSKEITLFDNTIQNLSVDKRLYFYALVEIMKSSWGSLMTIEGKKVPANSDNLTFIMEYLTKKGYQPQNDFLTAYKGLKDHSHLLPIYIKLLLLHKGLLDTEGFTKLGMESSEKLKEYKKIASPVERKLYNCMIKDLIPVIMQAIQEKSKRAELNEDDFKLFSDLISRATPGTCFDILSAIPIHTRPPQKQIALVNLLFLKLKYFVKEYRENGEELLQKEFGGKYTLLDLASACNLTDIYNAVIQLVPSANEKKNDSINEIFQGAVKQNQIENIKMMLDIPKININSMVLMAAESKDIKHETFDLLLKNKNANVNYKKDNQSLFLITLNNDDSSCQKIKSLIFHSDIDAKIAYQTFQNSVTKNSDRYNKIDGYFKDREILSHIPNMSSSHYSFHKSTSTSKSESVDEKKKQCVIS